MQIVFPLPVSYLPKRFSEGSVAMFEWLLPTPAQVGDLIVSPLSDGVHS